jgi:hypothetical protein
MLFAESHHAIKFDANEEGYNDTLTCLAGG